MAIQGDTCSYRHSEEVRTAAGFTKSRPFQKNEFQKKACIFFQQGRCTKGSACPFYHGSYAIRTLISPSHAQIMASTLIDRRGYNGHCLAWWLRCGTSSLPPFLFFFLSLLIFVLLGFFFACLLLLLSSLFVWDTGVIPREHPPVLFMHNQIPHASLYLRRLTNSPRLRR